MENSNEIPMKKYFFEKIGSVYVIYFKKGKRHSTEWFADINILEKAELITKALNEYNPNAGTTVVTEFYE